MTKTVIEWCDMTWNPVVGCKRGCWFCYARKLNDRFHFIEKWTDPQFFPERLKQPKMIKKPTVIFVGSMCDLFGDWVPREWIVEVLKVTQDNPQHEFMFLTKNPQRYIDFEFHKNCWIGATVEHLNTLATQSRLSFMEVINTQAKKYISIEPILGNFNNSDLSMFHKVIIGAMTGIRAVKPKREWVDSVKHHNIFYKDNIISHFPDLKNVS